MASKQEIEIDESLYVKDVDETEGSEETLPESIPLNGKSRVSDFSFALLMQKCGSILLNKKKTNKVKRLKETAMTNVINVLAFENDVILTKNQVYKKINNMKSRVKDKCLSGKKIQLNAGEKIFAALMETVGSSTIPEATGELMDLSGSELALRDQGLLCESIEIDPTSESQADMTPSKVGSSTIPEETAELMDLSGNELALRDQGLLCKSIELNPTSKSQADKTPSTVEYYIIPQATAELMDLSGNELALRDQGLLCKSIELNPTSKSQADKTPSTVEYYIIPQATGELMDLSGSELALRDQGLLCKSIEIDPTSELNADKTHTTVEYWIIPQATGESMDPSGSELVLRDRGLLCESIEIDPTSESLSSDKPDLVSVIETASNTSSKIVGSNIFGEFTQSNISGVSDDEQLSPKKDREENEIPDLTKHNIEELQKLVLIEQLNVLKAEKKFYEKACYVLGKCSQS
ncbi:uncharacterized protein LOC119083110 isoform X1 [Bradysia coprophila]|uniref:uncharacterized protein LOC119083110 isoform X1 n=1 Tax=Bradysia coprophila TaxID=38358 RepID=UPI00187DA973|nr:uncharacterized protein LOC119083110 isoform X1 [Bradysia coprophila]